MFLLSDIILEFLEFIFIVLLHKFSLFALKSVYNYNYIGDNFLYLKYLS